MALAVDVGVMAAALRWSGLDAAEAAFAGYSVGAIVHYGLSRRMVFRPGWLHDAWLAEFVGFVATGLCGLATTVAVVYVGTHLLGLSPAFSKTLAVVASFVVVYVMRAGFVFRSPRA